MTWLIRISLLLALAVALVAPAMANSPTTMPAGPGRTSGTAPKTYAPYPQPEGGYVTDIAGLLTPPEKDRLNDYCYTAEKETGVEVAVVTINSINDYPGTANSSIEAFAKGLFDTYGIGNLPKNNGVLLLVARQDRKVHIELGEYYGRSRDADSQRIIDQEILPRFKKNDYGTGIVEGTRAIMAEFAGLRIGGGIGGSWGHLSTSQIVLIVAVIALIPVCFSLFRHGKLGWGWVVAGIIIVLLVLIFKTGGKVLDKMPRGSSPGGFGGGFGGGSSGGGGATGSW